MLWCYSCYHLEDAHHRGDEHRIARHLTRSSPRVTSMLVTLREQKFESEGDEKSAR